MHCELVVPGLFGGGAVPRFAALELLLARGRRTASAAQPLESWLQEAFALGEGPFPAGALTLVASGGDPANGRWARADPVHLRVMRESLVVVPAESFELSGEEAEALCEALNRHLPGLSFTAAAPRRWCAEVSEALSIEDGSALAWVGREAEPPAQAAPLLTELQMVLHAHPVNEAREARGEPAVNSVWLWGAGRAPRSSCPWQSVTAEDPAALGAARLAGARQRALPGSAQDWLERLSGEGRHLALLDALRIPLALAPQTLPAAIEALERDWFAPLLAALRAGRIGMLTLHVPDAADALSFEITKGDLRRFWRLRKSIERYA